MERKAYEVVVENGKFLYKQTGELLNTLDDEDAKWIFVLSTTKTLYVGKKKKGTFQHSSFLAGGATTAAGRLIVDKGTLKVLSLNISSFTLQILFGRFNCYLNEFFLLLSFFYRQFGLTVDIISLPKKILRTLSHSSTRTMSI